MATRSGVRSKSKCSGGGMTGKQEVAEPRVLLKESQAELVSASIQLSSSGMSPD